MSSRRRTTKDSTSKERSDDEAGARHRILDAAFTAFMENGYSAASTLDIATRARVSKRELYTLVGSKQEMLAACITQRAQRMRVPADLPVPRDREGLTQLLVAFGAQLLGEVTDPTVIAVFRLAIAEAVHAPEVARALDSIGRAATRVALNTIMTQAQATGLVEGRPGELADQFGSMLFGDVIMSLLLGLEARPSQRELTRRAREATTAFMQLHPAPLR
ncbi:MAG TPA: TetR/AcrR family transcriptional regulator [Polyangiaceae bacterium]|jgi:AcrR family transcriptional regulator